DISVLANSFDQREGRYGIYRGIEELLIALCARDDIALTAVGLCGVSRFLDSTDPLVDSIRASLYLEERGPDVPCAFRHTFRSNFGLTQLYARVFRATMSGELDRLAPYSLSRFYLRLAR